MDELTRLRKENERLKKQVQEGRDFVRLNAKVSDAVLVILASVVYFLSVHFVSTLAMYGFDSAFRTMSPEFIIFFYLGSIIILYTAGIFYVITNLCDIFDEDITRFGLWLGSLFSKKPKQNPKKKSAKKKSNSKQKRLPNGRFAPKNA